MFRPILLFLLRAIVTVAEIFVLLVVELLAAMLVYSYLNLYHVAIFGYLVRIAGHVLDALVGQLEYWLPLSANFAYATLIGELGPKSILLLLIGLITAIVIRFFVRSMSRLIARVQTLNPVVKTA